jgi:hypothetical protein
MEWNNTNIQNLTDQHLTNLIPYIKRIQFPPIDKLISEGKYDEFILLKCKSAIQARIDCIQAELDFRKTSIDNRIKFERLEAGLENYISEFQSNEKKHRKGNWITQSEFIKESKIRSDEKFEDTFGFHPDYELDDMEEYNFNNFD